MSEFDQWVGRVSNWTSSASNIPMLAREDLVKARIKLEEPKHGYTSLFEDPLSVHYVMGYKDRKYSLSYDMLKKIPSQLSIVASILQTRCNQVASFSVPFRNSKSVGYVVKHKNPGRSTTKGEREMIQDMEKFIYACGYKDPNPHNPFPRDDFETFLKKVVRDSLMYDQMTFEIVPDRRGTPYEFMAVDASTIRLAAPMVTGVEGMDNRELPLSSSLRSGEINSNMFGWGGPYRSAAPDPYRLLRLTSRNANDRPSFVQVHNGQIWNVYTKDELAFGVRNPRTDIYIQGYGQSELEMLIQTITSHLYAEEYNRRFFMQGTSPKGMLSFKGDSMTPDQLEVFRRQWRAQMEGVQNSWKTPIFQSDQGIEWIPLDRSNAEMEYSQWMEYLIKITCGVFLIDPAELNFDLHGGVSQTPLFESSQEWKLKASRDKGLKPLLRFIAKQINEHVIEKIDDHFIFDFVGLDELTEMEKHELRKEQVSSYMTLNEIRRAEDLTDLPDGDIPMNPTYIQAMIARQQAEQMEQMSGGDPGQPGQQDQGQGAQDQSGDKEEHAPQYSDTFTKALSIKKNLLIAKALEGKSPAVAAAPSTRGEKYLEISLDDFITGARSE